MTHITHAMVLLWVACLCLLVLVLALADSPKQKPIVRVKADRPRQGRTLPPMA